ARRGHTAARWQPGDGGGPRRPAALYRRRGRAAAGLGGAAGGAVAVRPDAGRERRILRGRVAESVRARTGGGHPPAGGGDRPQPLLPVEPLGRLPARGLGGGGGPPPG